jgi:hypothetical protein
MDGWALISTWIADGTQIFVCHLCFLNLTLKFSQWYTANIIGAACNSHILQAHLHVRLSFVLYMQKTTEAIEVLIIETFVD